MVSNDGQLNLTSTAPVTKRRRNPFPYEQATYIVFASKMDQLISHQTLWTQPTSYRRSRRSCRRYMLLFPLPMVVFVALSVVNEALVAQQRGLEMKGLENDEYLNKIASNTWQQYIPKQTDHDLNVRPLGPRATRQAANYRNGTGLIVNVHITHHGGTTFCHAVGKSPDAKGGTPSQACWIVRGQDGPPPNYPHHNPWMADETSRNIATARKVFHMISWEYDSPPSVALQETNWEDPNLFSVIVMRHPIKRLLAGDGRVARKYPGVTKGTAMRETLERYATSNFTDNYALRVLAGRECCQGKDTGRKHLNTAKALIQRFSVVIDIECLSESLQLLAKNEWNITLGKLYNGKKRDDPRTRIGHSDIYAQLEIRNQMDIELYNWSKSISYVDCNSLSSMKKEQV